MRICTVMQLGEATTCAPQSLNVTWAKSTFMYAGTIYFSSLPNCVKSATSVNSFQNMLIKYFLL